MKKKMVIRIAMSGNKTGSKAMQIAASINGVQSVKLGDKDKDQIEVIGEGVDPVKLTCSLRKKLGKWPRFSCFLPKSMMACVELVSVDDADKKQEKKDEKKDKKKDEKKDEPKPNVQPLVWSYGSSVPLYIYYEDPYCTCSIL